MDHLKPSTGPRICGTGPAAQLIAQFWQATIDDIWWRDWLQRSLGQARQSSRHLHLAPSTRGPLLPRPVPLQATMR